MLWNREMRVHRRRRLGSWALLLLLLALLAAAGSLYVFRDRLRSPQALYGAAERAGPERAAALYVRLAQELPQIDEYAQLWAAERVMPGLDALRTLQAVIAYRPQSPAAYQAHLSLARHYAALEAPQAEEQYRAALALHDTVALRLELARYLEERGDEEAAYAEYRQLLRDRPDAFAGMRRTGADPLIVAEALIDATWYSDALEHLRDVDDSQAVPLRARALAGLGRHLEAATAYRAALDQDPDEVNAQLGLARAMTRLGQTQDALALYRKVDHADSTLGQAELLETSSPNRALALYRDAPHPVAWWSATRMLEARGRLTETLPLYARLGRSQTYLADDAAYRLYVLADRMGKQAARAEAQALLAGQGLNWLALRTGGGEFALNPAPPLAPVAEDVQDKAVALALLGRDDLARLEWVLAARFSERPEVDLAAAQALAARGDAIDAQEIAQAYTQADPRAPLAFWQLSYPRPYAEVVQAAAAEFGVDPLLIWAIMREESRYDPQALSWAGARGLMQIMPATQDWIAGELGEELAPGDAYDPQSNIRMAAWYLDFLAGYFDNDLELMILAYNGGAGSVDTWLDDPLVSDREDLLRWIGFGETREYLSRVSLSYLVYQELYANNDDP
jgi:soluble lytic murein transglycosylase